MSIAHARRTDPSTSKAAARKATANLPALKRAILATFQEHGPMVGSTLNRVYEFEQGLYGGPDCKYDSPRKRAGELVRDGLLERAGRLDGESVYAITEKGREAIR